jgi:ketosteroid isomerase-like protein
MTVEDTTLQQRIDEVGSVLTSGDTDRTGDLYTEDGQVMPPGSDIVTGRGAVAEFWQGVLEMGVDTIEIETLEIEAHQEMASRVGMATLQDAEGETIDDVKFIELWKREDGEWRIHRDIWNSNTAEGE